MAKKKSGRGTGLISHGTVADNRKARFNYEVGEQLETGIVLTGTEVKSLRLGRCNIAEAYAAVEGGELWLINAHIPEYESAGHFSHAPRRKRKLLAHRREIARMDMAVGKSGMTLVPLGVYFDNRGRAKVKLGFAKGRKDHDKRDVIKNRDWERQKARILREQN